ncbi:hypothetical protein [Actinokineospora pegani]|uniref:hypothetical protein n=1 Tax=Actinokineospora pegani TaxID=2654637 RepID=UPI0012E9FC5E|nr:hypothetical protein [Actinokineospora pegani]
MADRVPLDLGEPASARRKGCATGFVVLVFGAAVGGLAGLVAGRTAGLIAFVVVAVLLGVLVWAMASRTVWLEGTTVVARTITRRSVDLVTAERLELLVTDVRGARTIGILVGSGRRSVSMSLAVYSGTGGRELGILVLRKLADIFATSENTAGLVFSELLVAQLRAEAKGEAAPDRPLYQLASVAPAGRLAQRLKPEAVTRFVASLD